MIGKRQLHGGAADKDDNRFVSRSQQVVEKAQLLAGNPHVRAVSGFGLERFVQADEDNGRFGSGCQLKCLLTERIRASSVAFESLGKSRQVKASSRECIQRALSPGWIHPR